jgi:aminopeptidase-like protein
MNAQLKYSLTDDELAQNGKNMFQLMEDLFPICRSITGNGVRDTLKILSRYIPLKTFEIPTGTEVFDWTIPREWNIKDAYIIDPVGEKIVDFNDNNIHVVNYSSPVNDMFTLEELKPHLYSLPNRPNTTPYRTTYFNEDWGFCLEHNKLKHLKDGEYKVVIDSQLTDGFLTYGECYLRGKETAEVVLSCYTCHPSLCNDNLSGIVLTTYIAKYLSSLALNYSYRFLYIPETIGAITWLHQNEEKVKNIKHGLVLTCLGDPGNSTYKKSRQGNAEIDDAVINVLKHSGDDFQVVDFFPSGSDERQFCSPGFNLPFGSLVRTLYGRFPEYHTSDDNLSFVKPEYLADSFSKFLSTIYILENNKTFENLNPKCEPQLGKRGLYTRTKPGSKEIDARRWVLNFSDGQYSLMDISKRSGLSFTLIKEAADILLRAGLLKECH